jgi:hypothetical protein
VSLGDHVILTALSNFTLTPISYPYPYIQLAASDVTLVTVGGTVSFIITKLVPVIGHHHVSLTLICTVVVHSAGVNAGLLALVHNDTHHNHVLYDMLAGDGHRVHHNVHTVVPP